MVNKVITFSKDQPATSTLMVYSDIKLKASPAPLIIQPIFKPKTGIEYLEENNDDFLLANNGNSNENGEKILLVGNEVYENINASDYNKLQRQKSHFKLDKNINVNAIKQSIKNIFTWMPGQRILNPEFGSKLRSYLYHGITNQNVEAIIAEVKHCFVEWEPRAQLESVQDISNINDTEDNTVQIQIIYSIPSLSPEQYSYTIEVEKTV